MKIRANESCLNQICILLLIIFLFVITLQCQKKSVRSDQTGSQNAQIEVFANPACPHCQELIKQLDKDKIPYIYSNIVSNKDNKEKLWKLLRKYKPDTTSVPLPVVFVRNKLFLRPEYSRVIKVLNQ